MIRLKQGDYTGVISSQNYLQDCILTNTFYGSTHNPDWHYHQNLHISFVYENGKASTKSKSIYSTKSGTLFFYHAGEVHKWVSSNPLSKSLNLEVGKKFLDEYLLSEETIQTAITTGPNTRSLLLRIQTEMLSQDRDEQNVLSLLLELLTDHESKKSIDKPEWAKRAKELLNDRWQEPLSLIEIAKSVNVHPVTLSKNFRKYFYYSFGDYRNKIRIERSLDLIKYSDRSLCEISNICNFSDQSHFTRVFKKAVGLLPKNYRVS